MGLTPRERLALVRMENQLSREDPVLASLLGCGPAEDPRSVVLRTCCALATSLIVAAVLMVVGVATGILVLIGTGLCLLVVAPWTATIVLLMRIRRVRPR
jgi:hypothetical protein